MYQVMIRCPTGTLSTHNGVGGMFCEVDMHVLTWCYEPNEAAAMRTVSELLAGARPGYMDAWYQRRA